MKKELKTYWLIILVSLGAFSIGVDAYLVAGLLSSLSQNLHITVANIGILISCYMLCYGIFSPIFSVFLTQVNVRLVLCLALVIFIAGNTICAISSGYLNLILGRVLAGLGAGIYMPFSISLIVTLSEKNKKGRSLGYIFTSMALGTITGVPIGILIAQHINWQASFIFVCILAFISLIFLWYGAPSIKIKSPPTLSQRIGILKNKKVAAITFVSSFCAMGGLAVYSFLPLLLSTMLIDKNKIIFATFMWGLGGILGSFLSGRILDKYNKPALIVAFLIASIILMINLIVHVAVVFPLLMICMFIWGFAGWGLQAPQQFLIHQHAHEYGAIAMSLSLSMRYTGIAIGTALISGLMNSGMSINSIPILGSAFVCIALLVHVIFVWKPINQCNKI